MLLAVAGRAEPLHIQWSAIVLVMSLNFMDAAASLTPQWHYKLTILDRDPDKLVCLHLGRVHGAVATLDFAVFGRVTMFACVHALVFAAAVSTPGLKPINAAPTDPEFAGGLSHAAAAARLHRKGSPEPGMGCSASARIRWSWKAVTTTSIRVSTSSRL